MMMGRTFLRGIGRCSERRNTCRLLWFVEGRARERVHTPATDFVTIVVSAHNLWISDDIGGQTTKPKDSVKYPSLEMTKDVAHEAESAVHRALSVIAVFSYAEPVMGVSQIGRKLNLPKTTVHRLLATLVADGWVDKTPQGRYRLSLRIYEIGQQAVESHGLRQLGHAPLERLHNETGETTHLAVLTGTDVLYVDRLESRQLMNLFTRIGRRAAAHATSSGKCLLAYGESSAVDLVIAAGLPRLAQRTITTPATLKQSLAEVRKNGYAISINESAAEVVSIGAPIFDRRGACVAAVSVAGPSLRMPPESYTRTIRFVVRAAADISKAVTKDPDW
jgi:DNA-binding IclR family transcriptional regulator